MPARLKDIAQMTALNVSSVSRVLNDAAWRGVTQRKREHVLRVARQVGYQPHRSARALRTGRHFNIAYVLADSPALRSDLEVPFTRFRLYGMDEVLTARGYLLSLLRLESDRPQSLGEKAQHVDGLVLNVRAPSREVVALLRTASLPAVMIEGDVFEQSEHTVSCVLSDRKAGMSQAVSHLIQHGHQRIAFISKYNNYQRLAGYLQAFQEHGLARDERLIKLWSESTDILAGARRQGYQLTKELLADKAPFTAIQAGSDFTAAGVIDALREAGLRVPGEVAVAGFDDVDSLKLSPFREPFLTTVHDPNFEMGQTAAELLLAQIEEGADPQRVVLPTRLVIRESCGASGGSGACG